ncbi:hypothetical protein AU252_00715 [Pseudarthrobacter sulfonivorans]|uniref:Uncharacterized protein n=1 Tax=Pseudarthrobacter sulfonivorans TaxID=121292 RepID=A0A0U3Q3Q5_9MICC|nr:hypothetical protein [Pseudarthrobacter sulfonivorans]ALV39866.1 hypothetical protein AU252_00715 [Pseudarthrobacter sulfonivorans]
MPTYRHDNWDQLIGALIEVRKNQKVLRTGRVDDAMSDSSCLWLAADANNNRALFEAAEGYEAWVEPLQLEGRLFNRMPAPALHPETQVQIVCRPE